jgi:hypothetical protein
VALLIPNEGEVQLLADLLGGGALENWKFRLYTSATTPAETDVAATYTEATFTGYTAGGNTLTRSLSAGTWSTPASGAPTGAWSAEAAVAESTYNAGSPQTWNATSAQTIVGYYIVGGTSGKLIGAEKFAASISLVNPSTLTIVPRIGAS